MGTFSIGHWLVVALVVALLFGPRRLGDLGRGLGDGLRQFKNGLRDDDSTTAIEPSSPRTEQNRDDEKG